MELLWPMECSKYKVDVKSQKFHHPFSIFGLKFYLKGRSGMTHPVNSPHEPIRCVPVCEMKFSGLGSSRPRYCPPSQLQYLAKIATLLKTTSISVSNDGRCSLRGDTHQILKDSQGLQLFEASVIPLGRVHRRMVQLFKRSNPGFKVLVKDGEGSTVLSMICKGSALNDVSSESDEMEVFLAKCKVYIGKVVKLPSVFSEFVVFDEKGDRMYHIHILSSVIEFSCIVTTYEIFHTQLQQVIGFVKYSKRTWARFLPNCCLSFGPYAVTFDMMIPLTHKALLLGSLFFVLERSSWNTNRYPVKPFYVVKNQK